MPLKDCMVIVLGGNDDKFPSICESLSSEYNIRDVVCVHTPIGFNKTITINGLYDSLKNSTKEFVVVLSELELAKGDIEGVVRKFDKERLQSVKPLLYKGVKSLEFEWRNKFDFSAAWIVASRKDLYDAIESQC
jgi:hypothetical protein